MNDGKLSQDEIDALLKISEEEEITSSHSPDLLTTMEIDTLGEIGNISFGNSATTLSTLLNQKVEIAAPRVSVITKNALDDEFNTEPLVVYADYVEGLDGQNVLLMKSDVATIIADIMLGGDETAPETTLKEHHISSLQEVMNKLTETAASSMSTIYEAPVSTSSPEVTIGQSGSIQRKKAIVNENYFVKVTYQFNIGNLIDSDIVQIIPLSFAKEMVRRLSEASSVKSREERAVTPDKTKTEAHPRSDGDNNSPQFIGDNVSPKSSIQQASFSDFGPQESIQNEKRNLDMLLDIPLKVSVELGRTQRSIKDILKLSAGSIVELDKLAGEPVDILVNEKLVAKGEVVVIDENFGVRVTDIISQTDRLMNLK
ncbi:flagellar motor switch protein FliN/FliY [Lentibacillus persicus]|uniref:Flagellar motor switch protein FliN/FliY n=1 Tax=Lentibacillus persicus TaxID=640948 RepID=A0A1I1VBZ0_9BACI|nr:flagellar motor switch phosphatase FliY [Lentibacillus persicus]SFD80399.1 flagellar motor switch protein FliN/FliY [Lentibacillus persicus]